MLFTYSEHHLHLTLQISDGVFIYSFESLFVNLIYSVVNVSDTLLITELSVSYCSGQQLLCKKQLEKYHREESSIIFHSCVYWLVWETRSLEG